MNLHKVRLLGLRFFGLAVLVSMLAFAFACGSADTDEGDGDGGGGDAPAAAVEEVPSGPPWR